MGEREDYHESLVPWWAKGVESEELPEVYREMAEVIGVEPTLKLAQVFSGNNVYFPKLERSLIRVRNRVIRHQFNGANIKELARRWRLSARHIRSIVNPPRQGP